MGLLTVLPPSKFAVLDGCYFLKFEIASWKELKIAQNAQINQLFQLVNKVTPMRSAKIRLSIIWVPCMALLLSQRSRLMRASKEWLYVHDARGVRLCPHDFVYDCKHVRLTSLVSCLQNFSWGQKPWVGFRPKKESHRVKSGWIYTGYSLEPGKYIHKFQSEDLCTTVYNYCFDLKFRHLAGICEYFPLGPFLPTQQTVPGSWRMGRG